MPMKPQQSRRAFLTSLGAVSAFGASAAERVAREVLPAEPQQRSGTLAPTTDFLFAPGLIYLQTGSLGPTPRPIMEHTIAAWRELESDPIVFGYGRHEKAMEGVRARAAALLGCKTDEVVVTRSTTDGMNWVAQGLDLRTGDHVLTTDQEHPGGRVGWDYLARTRGVVLDVVKVPPGENDAQAIVDRFQRAVTRRTRVLSFSHLLTSTGLRMPVAELCALSRRRGCIAVVDGAQAPGGIHVDVKALGCHVYVTCGHKWLLGPKGTGLLYLNEELGQRVDPIALQAGRTAYSDSSGVGNIPGILGLGAAIEYVSGIGVAAIERHNLALRNRAYVSLQTIHGIKVVSPSPGDLASPLLTYVLPATVPSVIMHDRLRERHGVEVKVVPAQWFNGNRISTHLFNSSDDVDAFVAALNAEMTA